jgi:hypothetical protein
MPTICFSDDFTTKQKIILTKTFRQNCSDLGLTDFDATIQLHKQKMESAGAMCRVGKDYFLMVFDATEGLVDAIFTLGHELVHVRQYRTGQLRDDDETGGTYWGKTFVPAVRCNSRKYYSTLPWEIEAHNLDGNLFERAMKRLNDPTAELTEFRGVNRTQ